MENEDCFKSNLIKVPIEPWMKEKAILAHKQGAYNGNSFLRGDGNFGGMIGECMVYDYLKRLTEDLIYKSTKDYDFILQHKTIDVKTKHQVVSDIKSDYEASVTEQSLHQNCDTYIFCRWKWETSVSGEKLSDEHGYPITNYGWIIGWITKKDFLNNATRYAKNDIQRDKQNFRIKNDCRNICYEKLKPISCLVDYLKLSKVEKNAEKYFMRLVS